MSYSVGTLPAVWRTASPPVDPFADQGPWPWPGPGPWRGCGWALGVLRRKPWEPAPDTGLWGSKPNKKVRLDWCDAASFTQKVLWPKKMWPYLPKWVTWIFSAILRFLQQHWLCIKMMQKNYQNRSTGFEIMTMSLTPKSVILRNRQIKLSSYILDGGLLNCFKHILMTLINCLYYVTSVFFMYKNWRNWFSWKAKMDTYATPFGKVAVPHEWTSSNVTHVGREGHK